MMSPTRPRAERGRLSDRITQRWVRLTGRGFDPREMPWLDGPSGTPRGIGADFYSSLAAEHDLQLCDQRPQGLMPDFAALAGPAFDSSRVDPEIARFYEEMADLPPAALSARAEDSVTPC